MIKYDVDYYYNLLKLHASTAREICGIRWKFILDNCSLFAIDSPREVPFINVLDYGCGIGYMKAFAPESVSVDTYDIMPTVQTGIRSNAYDVVMLYDVLEHIPDFTELLPVLQKAQYVVVTVPVKPDNVEWKDYRHFKPGEHLHYFDDSLLKHIFSTMGFDYIISGTPECPPRKHVWSYIFKRKD